MRPGERAVLPEEAILRDPSPLVAFVIVALLGALLVYLGLLVTTPAPFPIDHELDALRAAQVRAWTGGTAEKPTRVCCPCPCGALAFCKGGDE